MTLAEATARPLIENWAAVVQTSWTDRETDTVVDAVVRLSPHVTPHVVRDAPMTDDRLQEYLLARAARRLEDWLTGAAAALRVAYGIDAAHHTDSGAPALGLRSATSAELEALPGVGRALAGPVGRFVAQQPELTSLDPLIDIDGVGPGRLRQIMETAYLDRPRLSLLSHTLLAFLLAPKVPAFLRVLERSDMAVAFGDTTSLLRRGVAEGDSPGKRFIAFLELVLEQAARTSSPAGGVLASAAERWLNRHERRRQLLAATAPADGGLVVNESYVAAARQLIERAAATVHLMVFLGTATEGDELHPGPAVLVEAMEAAARRGVTVRAILDQDDGGEPYGSFFINRPLLERFRANGIQAKFDEEDVLLHSKVLVVDAAAIVVGSHNWTRNGFRETHEVSLLIESPPVAEQFDARFRALWDHLPALA